MNFKIPAFPRSSGGRFSAVLMLMLFAWSAVHAQVDPNIRLGNPCGVQPKNPLIYALKTGDQLPPTPPDTFPGPTPPEISATNPMGMPLVGNVFWALAGQGQQCSGTTDQLIQCGGVGAMNTDPVFNVKAPDDPEGDGNSPTVTSGRVQITTTRKLLSTDLNRAGNFTTTVSAAPSGDPTCSWNYRVEVTSSGGGWGDPHITTVDGVHYDFQSAGEFTALRQEGLEIQTRQKPVPSASIPLRNDYTGLTSCVAVYSAAAAHIGSNRVSLQPNINGEPDPSGMQLRVNGMLMTVPDGGVLLRAGGGKNPTGEVEGRITRVGDGGYEIRNERGTQIVITPHFWQGPQTWYLNINVYQTSARDGIMGLIADGSWLPALPDGTSVGPMPEGTQVRYQVLYEQFADAWRVTDATSLFDYAPGTNTATFTLDEWPRNNPRSCALQGQTSVQPAPPEVAEKACGGITDAALRADCIFDVTVTGETAFAESYADMQEFQPTGTGWQPPLVPPDSTPTPTPTPFPWWWILILIIILIIIAIVILRKKKTA